jgi:retron-type reverse transcriptase
MRCPTLAPLSDVAVRREAYHRTRKESAPGIEGVTAEQSAEHREEHLRDLPEPLRSGRYQAPPGKRHGLAKADGSQGPSGVPTVEEKIVPRGVTLVLGAIYEQDCQEFWPGFRAGHSAHQALSELGEQCLGMNTGGIGEADVSGLFDSLAQSRLQEMLQQGVKDGRILRLIGNWRPAGVGEGEPCLQPETGSPQGAVISPRLGNLFLPQVVDDGYRRDVRPRLRGRSFLIRCGADFVIGCEYEADARRLLAVLPQRVARFGLTLHPQKTALVPFRKPPAREAAAWGRGPFEFRGFTHYWRRARRG